MSFKYTPNTLKKMEGLFDEARYIILQCGGAHQCAAGDTAVHKCE